MTDMLGIASTDYQLIVRSTNMAPEIQAGDRVFARQATTAQVGQVVVALVDDVATIRRYMTGDRVLGLVVALARTLS